VRIANPTDAQLAALAQGRQFWIPCGAQAFGVAVIEPLRQPEHSALIFRREIACPRALNPFCWVAMPTRAAQQRHGMFPLIAGRGDKLIQDLSAFFVEGEGSFALGFAPRSAQCEPVRCVYLWRNQDSSTTSLPLI
jgi:hypothetical protein